MLNILKVPEGLVARSAELDGAPVGDRLADQLQLLAADFIALAHAETLSEDVRSMAQEGCRSAAFLWQVARDLSRVAQGVARQGPQEPTTHRTLLRLARMAFARAGDTKASRTAEALIALSDRLVATLEATAAAGDRD